MAAQQQQQQQQEKEEGGGKESRKHTHTQTLIIINSKCLKSLQKDRHGVAAWSREGAAMREQSAGQRETLAQQQQQVRLRFVL